MEKLPFSGSEQKIQEYANRIQNGESKDSIFEGLPESFKSSIDKKLDESSEENESIETARAQRYKADQEKIGELREQLGITKPLEKTGALQGPPINYIDVVIDDAFMQKNLMSNGGLRMQGGQANWNGEVDLIRYSISEKLSPQYQDIAKDKIEKKHAGEEQMYQHESHHIGNRENGLAPHVAAENLREFLTFRVLDELSAFTTGELYNQDITPENILAALEKAKQDIDDSYYGEPFENDMKWYTSQHGNKSEAFSRQINQEKYHQVMRQYFKINGKDILNIIGKSGMMPEFTKILNELILKLDNIMNAQRIDN